MSKKILSDVVYIRLFLIIGVVLYHAFSPFCGAWAPVSTVSIPLYWWIGKFSYSFLMESFVFISGYVYGFQVENSCLRGERLSFKGLIKRKFLRLMVPSLLFSILYVLLLGSPGKSIGNTILYILNGAGHLWFLPMLFVCFILCFVLEKVSISRKLKIIFLLLLTIVPFPAIPFRINLSFHYMLFFYIGFLMKGDSSCLLQIMVSKRGIIFQGIVFIL